MGGTRELKEEEYSADELLGFLRSRYKYLNNALNESKHMQASTVF